MKWFALLALGAIIGVPLYYTVGVMGALIVALAFTLVGYYWQWIEWRWRRLVRWYRQQMQPRRRSRRA